MKRPALIAILVCVTLLGSALYVTAAPPVGPCGGPCDGNEQHPDRFLKKLTRVLDLSEAQQASIKKVQAAEQEKTAALHEQKKENRQQLRLAESVQPFDENAVRVLAEQGGTIESELTILRARAHSQIDAILTPEQRQLANKLRPEGGGEKHRGVRRQG